MVAGCGIFPRLMTAPILRAAQARLVTGLAALLLVVQASASDLYVGEVALAENEPVTPALLLQALDQVLVRLTGRTDQSPSAFLRLSSDDLGGLLQGQQRVRVERLDEEGQRVTESRLRVDFYPVAVDRLLADAGLQRLGRERPSILLWVVVEDQGAPDWNDDPLLEQVLVEQARRFGLDVIRPLRDALDMTSVGPSDVRGGFLEAAEASADRYRADVIAMLDLRRDADLYSGRWFWRIDGRDSSLGLTAESPFKLIVDGYTALLAAMVARYGTSAGAGEDLTERVVVEGIVDSIHYAEVLRYLGGLSLVERVRVTRAGQRAVEFELSVTGQGLGDLIELGRILTVEERSADGRWILRLNR